MLILNLIVWIERLYLEINEKKHLSVDIAKNIYDVFALSKWFEYDEDWNLTKNLDDNL